MEVGPSPHAQAFCQAWPGRAEPCQARLVKLGLAWPGHFGRNIGKNRPSFVAIRLAFFIAFPIMSAQYSGGFWLLSCIFSADQVRSVSSRWDWGGRFAREFTIRTWSMHWLSKDRGWPLSRWSFFYCFIMTAGKRVQTSPPTWLETLLFGMFLFLFGLAFTSVPTAHPPNHRCFMKWLYFWLPDLPIVPFYAKFRAGFIFEV